VEGNVKNLYFRKHIPYEFFDGIRIFDNDNLLVPERCSHTVYVGAFSTDRLTEFPFSNYKNNLVIYKHAILSKSTGQTFKKRHAPQFVSGQLHGHRTTLKVLFVDVKDLGVARVEYR